jgi:hypothetical protein
VSSPLPLPPGFDELSVQERIAYVQSLWDAIVSESDRRRLVPLSRAADAYAELECGRNVGKIVRTAE